MRHEGSSYGHDVGLQPVLHCHDHGMQYRQFVKLDGVVNEAVLVHPVPVQVAAHDGQFDGIVYVVFGCTKYPVLIHPDGFANGPTQVPLKRK